MPPPQRIMSAGRTPVTTGARQRTPSSTSRYSEAPTGTTDYHSIRSPNTSHSFMKSPLHHSRRNSGDAPEVVHPAFRAGVNAAEEEAVSPRTAAPAPRSPSEDKAPALPASMFHNSASPKTLAQAGTESNERKFSLAFGKRDSTRHAPQESSLQRKRTVGDLRHSIVQVGKRLIPGAKRPHCNNEEHEERPSGRSAAAIRMNCGMDHADVKCCSQYRRHSEHRLVTPPEPGRGDSSYNTQEPVELPASP